MAVPDPQELLQQAAWLVQTRQPGPPLQVDVRRAISAAYYAVFHCVVAAVADQFIGKKHRGRAHYVLVYRSLDHRRLKSVCGSIRTKDVSRWLPSGGAGEDLRNFSDNVVDLQGKRHDADYNPAGLFYTADAKTAIGGAREALTYFDQVSGDGRLAFLTLLAFPIRT